MTTKTHQAIILFLDSARGQYIPRDFAQCIKREAVTGVSPATLENLAKEDSNTKEDYWELWQEVLDKARSSIPTATSTTCIKTATCGCTITAS